MGIWVPLVDTGLSEEEKVDQLHNIDANYQDGSFKALQFPIFPENRERELEGQILRLLIRSQIDRRSLLRAIKKQIDWGFLEAFIPQVSCNTRSNYTPRLIQVTDTTAARDPIRLLKTAWGFVLSFVLQESNSNIESTLRAFPDSYFPTGYALFLLHQQRPQAFLDQQPYLKFLSQALQLPHYEYASKVVAAIESQNRIPGFRPLYRGAALWQDDRPLDDAQLGYVTTDFEYSLSTEANFRRARGILLFFGRHHADILPGAVADYVDEAILHECFFYRPDTPRASLIGHTLVRQGTPALTECLISELRNLHDYMMQRTTGLTEAARSFFMESCRQTESHVRANIRNGGGVWRRQEYSYYVPHHGLPEDDVYQILWNYRNPGAGSPPPRYVEEQHWAQDFSEPMQVDDSAVAPDEAPQGDEHLDSGQSSAFLHVQSENRKDERQSSETVVQENHLDEHLDSPEALEQEDRRLTVASQDTQETEFLDAQQENRRLTLASQNTQETEFLDAHDTQEDDDVNVQDDETEDEDAMEDDELFDEDEADRRTTLTQRDDIVLEADDEEYPESRHGTIVRQPVQEDEEPDRRSTIVPQPEEAAPSPQLETDPLDVEEGIAEDQQLEVNDQVQDAESEPSNVPDGQEVGVILAGFARPVPVPIPAAPYRVDEAVVRRQEEDTLHAPDHSHDILPSDDDVDDDDARASDTESDQSDGQDGEDGTALAGFALPAPVPAAPHRVDEGYLGEVSQGTEDEEEHEILRTTSQAETSVEETTGVFEPEAGPTVQVPLQPVARAPTVDDGYEPDHSHGQLDVDGLPDQTPVRPIVVPRPISGYEAEASQCNTEEEAELTEHEEEKQKVDSPEPVVASVVKSPEHRTYSDMSAADEKSQNDEGVSEEVSEIEDTRPGETSEIEDSRPVPGGARTLRDFAISAQQESYPATRAERTEGRSDGYTGDSSAPSTVVHSGAISSGQESQVLDPHQSGAFSSGQESQASKQQPAVDKKPQDDTATNEALEVRDVAEGEPATSREASMEKKEATDVAVAVRPTEEAVELPPPEAQESEVARTDSRDEETDDDRVDGASLADESANSVSVMGPPTPSVPVQLEASPGASSLGMLSRTDDIVPEDVHVPADMAIDSDHTPKAGNNIIPVALRSSASSPARSGSLTRTPLRSDVPPMLPTIPESSSAFAPEEVNRKRSADDAADADDEASKAPPAKRTKKSPVGKKQSSSKKRKTTDEDASETETKPASTSNEDVDPKPVRSSKRRRGVTSTVADEEQPEKEQVGSKEEKPARVTRRSKRLVKDGDDDVSVQSVRSTASRTSRASRSSKAKSTQTARSSKRVTQLTETEPEKDVIPEESKDAQMDVEDEEKDVTERTTRGRPGKRATRASKKKEFKPEGDEDTGDESDKKPAARGTRSSTRKTREKRSDDTDTDEEPDISSVTSKARKLRTTKRATRATMQKEIEHEIEKGSDDEELTVQDDDDVAEVELPPTRSRSKKQQKVSDDQSARSTRSTASRVTRASSRATRNETKEDEGSTTSKTSTRTVSTRRTAASSAASVPRPPRPKHRSTKQADDTSSTMSTRTRSRGTPQKKSSRDTPQKKETPRRSKRIQSKK